ncbi:hypothetical protein TRICI_002691 [Trichomonascus ciferrii]|uniref:Uncharacterized protein n=1 Tax=Trichomonascus ciferrii TaxID=44093 RepID=A0A642V5T4_9ASCO|nr:hypothetical protein TRICI_002691 [Trichomonascus ciferrii]
MDRREILFWYKELVKHGLYAVSYRQPQKDIYLSILRKRFRDPPTVSPSAIQNTVQFVKNAASHQGMEQQILKQMIHVEYSRLRAKKPPREDVYLGYTQTVQALNKTMDLAL